jgi:hypothetical protein
MSYRISNTEKWKDLWFSDLSPYAKLLFFYFVENCDNAGFFEVNKKFMLFHTGLTEEQLMSAGTELKKSYIKSKDGSKLWFRNFLKYQRKLPLNSSNMSHKPIIATIQDNLTDETKFKGNAVINSLLPSDYQTVKSQKKRKQVVSENNPENTEENPVKKRIKFVKPSVEEVCEYMIEHGFEFAKTQSDVFVNFYESKGWKIGKNPMIDWKASARLWIRSYYERNRILSPKKSKLEVLQESHTTTENIDWNKIYEKKQDEQHSQESND